MNACSCRIPIGDKPDTSLEKVLESRIHPRPLVMPPGGIENPALPVGANPGPRLAPLLVNSVGQNGAVFFIVEVMHIGLIPAFKATEALHHLMLGACDFGTKHACPMPLELGSHQLNHPLII